VLWAQRSNETDDEKNIVYLSVNAIDLQHPKVDLKATSVVVEGVQRETNNVYKVSLEFFAEIDVEVPFTVPLPIPSTSLLCFALFVGSGKCEWDKRLIWDSGRHRNGMLQIVESSSSFAKQRNKPNSGPA
jgi:hypothetical protein